MGADVGCIVSNQHVTHRSGLETGLGHWPEGSGMAEEDRDE